MDLEMARAILANWGRCINGGLPGGYGQPGLYGQSEGAIDWTPQADLVETALRMMRQDRQGFKRAEAIRLYYGTRLIFREQARTLKMPEREYEVFLNSAERNIIDILGNLDY